jgi:hypothetical protein
MAGLHYDPWSFRSHNARIWSNLLEAWKYPGVIEISTVDAKLWPPRNIIAFVVIQIPFFLRNTEMLQK